MINTALLKPYNLAVIAAIALIARFLFAKSFSCIGGTSGSDNLQPANPAGA